MNNFKKLNFTLDEKFNSYLNIMSEMNSDVINNFYNDISSFNSVILNALESQKNKLDTIGLWINHYNAGDFNEIHNYNSQEYNEKCDYTGILILDTGINESMIIYDENNSESNNYLLSKGDCFLIKNDTLRGLNEVQDRVIALMFMIKT
jgi:hypothetical protein